jgi:hypothetical protein
MTDAEQKKAFNDLNEAFKQGPAARIVLMPTGDDLMGGKQLGYQYATNAAGALLAAIVVSLMRPSVGFLARWFAVVLFGLFSWLSVNVPYHIWYRYPWPYVQDELFCALLTWALAGIAIAAIVKPRESTMGY